MKFSEPKKIDIINVDIHPEANATPMMTDEQYNALKLDIEKNGQIDPVILYRGRIVDGRHRYFIHRDLGIKDINTVSIPNNSTLAEIKSLVKSKETHRHQTPTQLAIYAYRQMIKHNSDASSKDKTMTQSDAAKEFGVVVKQIGRAARIDNKLLRPDILDMLFSGQKFNIGTIQRPLLTDSLQSIINHLDKIKSSEHDFDIGLEIEESLTEEDNFIIAKIMNVARNQKRVVREALSKRLYAELNDVVDEE